MAFVLCLRQKGFLFRASTIRVYSLHKKSFFPGGEQHFSWCAHALEAALMKTPAAKSFFPAGKTHIGVAEDAASGRVKRASPDHAISLEHFAIKSIHFSTATLPSLPCGAGQARQNAVCPLVRHGRPLSRPPSVCPQFIGKTL